MSLQKVSFEIVSEAEFIWHGGLAWRINNPAHIPAVGQTVSVENSRFKVIDVEHVYHKTGFVGQTVKIHLERL